MVLAIIIYLSTGRLRSKLVTRPYSATVVPFDLSAIADQLVVSFRVCGVRLGRKWRARCFAPLGQLGPLALAL